MEVGREDDFAGQCTKHWLAGFSLAIINCKCSYVAVAIQSTWKGFMTNILLLLAHFNNILGYFPLLNKTLINFHARSILQRSYIAIHPNRLVHSYLAIHPNHLVHTYIAIHPNRLVHTYLAIHPNHLVHTYLAIYPNHLVHTYLAIDPNHLVHTYILNQKL
jgi:hypothetical protein